MLGGWHSHQDGCLSAEHCGWLIHQQRIAPLPKPKRMQCSLLCSKRPYMCQVEQTHSLLTQAQCATNTKQFTMKMQAKCVIGADECGKVNNDAVTVCSSKFAKQYHVKEAQNYYMQISSFFCRISFFLVQTRELEQ